MTQPPVLVCGGGTRHVKAFELLKENGIDSHKGGSWKVFTERFRPHLIFQIPGHPMD
jgi:hypothetical protein